MQNNRKILGVIPARLDSTRLPRKVLRDILGKPMVHWVYERARRASFLSDLFIASDSDEILQYCQSHNLPSIKTRQHNSGSDRLHEVMERTDGDIYINIQGDEPTLRPDHIELLLQPLLSFKAEITTLKVAIGETAAQNPDNVKVVTDKAGWALYFSRSNIPFNQGARGEIRRFKHIGIYGYTRAALALFHQLPQSPLELAEKLEQLRFLENGIAIQVVETPYDTVGVDTEEDLGIAARALEKEQIEQSKTQ